jgi:hypothetical protein
MPSVKNESISSQKNRHSWAQNRIASRAASLSAGSPAENYVLRPPKWAFFSG